MAISRASASLLRIRAVTSRAKTPQGFAATQVRRKITASDGDLGGPGGQQPPPRNPGGPEAIKRNWVTIGGGALAAVAAYAYLTRPKVTGDKARQTDGSQPDAAELAEDAEKLSKKLGQQVADQTGQFIIEYVGELITHDEGVRREARRGDVFDEQSNVSYVFTLLENEGIWVDAATYGNLSRYINHASEHDTRGCNVTPQILYVSGEYRIKFTALRDIEAGEELFFNYGENFPNLTKKLLNHKATGKKPGRTAKATRLCRREKFGDVACKATEASDAGKGNSKRPRGRPRIKRELPPGFAWETVDTDQQIRTSRKRKRQLQEDCDCKDNLVLANGVDEASKRSSKLPGSPFVSCRGTGSSTETPTRRVMLTKKASGKRGGARRGRGRPRKHFPPGCTLPTPPEHASEPSADVAPALDADP